MKTSEFFQRIKSMDDNHPFVRWWKSMVSHDDWARSMEVRRQLAVFSMEAWGAAVSAEIERLEAENRELRQRPTTEQQVNEFYGD